jgi:toxin ParE1/3/4
MTRLTFSPAALIDLDAIYDYTYENWGTDQAEIYIMGIHKTCMDLATGDKKGRDASDIRVGYRKQLAGSHLAFYKQTDDELTIIRILHESRDFTRHF